MFSWFAIPFHAARLGFETQNAVAFRFMRLMGDASKTAGADKADDIADKIIKTIQPPDVQVVATNVAPSRGRRRKSANSGQKNPVPANKRKRSNSR